MGRVKTGAKPPVAEKTAANPATKQRGKPFPKGRSGNPAGKPRGTRNRLTRAAEQLLAGEAETITRKCVELAKAGDTTALRLCLDRLIPPARERRIELKLPPVKTAADVTNALSAVLAAVAAGEIAPGEAQAIAGLIDAARRSVETNHLEARIAELERRQDAEQSEKTS
jgi:hypothetical protein